MAGPRLRLLQKNLRQPCPAARACGAALLAESGADNMAGVFFVKAEAVLVPPLCAPAAALCKSVWALRPACVGKGRPF